MQVAKQPHQNSLETSPEKLQAAVRFFWNIAKLASVKYANRRKIMIFHHVTFATAGLLPVLFEIVYDP